MKNARSSGRKRPLAIRSFSQSRGSFTSAGTIVTSVSGSGRSYMFQGPWLVLAPGLCLTTVVFATNVFGDALRDLLDPRMRGSR